jgi:hypothetical protein
VEILAADTGKSLATFRRARQNPRQVAWSDDGTQIAIILQPADETSRASDEVVVFRVPRN